MSRAAPASTFCRKRTTSSRRHRTSLPQRKRTTTSLRSSKCGDDLTVYSGEDTQTLPIASLGGKGVISTFSNIMPKEMHELATASVAGDLKTAQALTFKYLDLMNALFMDVNPIPVKQALNLMGFNCGHCRLPLADMSDEQIAKLKTEMAKHLQPA